MVEYNYLLKRDLHFDKIRDEPLAFFCRRLISDFTGICGLSPRIAAAGPSAAPQCARRVFSGRAGNGNGFARGLLSRGARPGTSISKAFEDDGVGFVDDGGFEAREVDARGGFIVVSHPFAYDAQGDALCFGG